MSFLVNFKTIFEYTSKQNFEQELQNPIWSESRARIPSFLRVEFLSIAVAPFITNEIIVNEESF